MPSSVIARSIAAAGVAGTLACAASGDRRGAGDDAPAPPIGGAAAAVAAGEATAAAVAARPPSALWDADRVVERLVRAGVAPRRDSGVTRVPYLPVPATPVVVGGDAVVYAFIFADSAQRAAATGGLDSLTAAPAGALGPWAPPLLVVASNNLYAVIVGGTERQRERVWLALGAGLAAP